MEPALYLARALCIPNSSSFYLSLAISNPCQENDITSFPLQTALSAFFLIHDEYETSININIYMPNICLPSGDQTWLAGQWTIEIGDFPSYKPPLSSGIFQPVMFDTRLGKSSLSFPWFSHGFPMILPLSYGFSYRFPRIFSIFIIFH